MTDLTAIRANTARLRTVLASHTLTRQDTLRLVDAIDELTDLCELLDLKASVAELLTPPQ